MMEVRVNNLKEEVQQLTNLIGVYEDYYLNLYNELKNSSLFWSDGHSILFFDRIDLEKQKIASSISEISSIRDAYIYLITNYSNLGDKIQFNLDLRETVFQYLTEFLNKLDSMISSYQQLDLSFYSDAASIHNQISQLTNLKQKGIELKTSLEKKYNLIRDVEKEIKLILSKIEIKMLVESDISDLFVG